MVLVVTAMQTYCNYWTTPDLNEMKFVFSLMLKWYLLLSMLITHKCMMSKMECITLDPLGYFGLHVISLRCEMVLFIPLNINE